MAKNRLHIGTVVLMALALLKVTLLFWAANKGIEMTDEGYYLLWFRSAHLYPPDMHLNYYYLVQMFASFVEWDLLAMRIGGIVTELGAVFMLGWGLHEYLTKYQPKWYSNNLMVLLMAGGLASIFMAEHPRSLSYDSVTHLLVATGSGLLLYWLAIKEQLKNRLTLLVFLLLGFVLAAQFLVKFSSSVLLVTTWIVVLLAHRKQVKPAAAAGGLLLGLAFFAGWFFATQLSPAKLVEYYTISYQRISALGYTPWHIFFGTYVGKDLPHFSLNIAPALIVLVALWFGLKTKEPKLRFTAAMLMSLGVLILQFVLLKLSYFPQWHYRFIDLILWGLFTTGFLLWQHGGFKKHLYPIFILGVLPFTCAIGSAVNMPMSLFSYVPAWVLLALLLWQALASRLKIQRLSKGMQYGTIVASFVVFGQVFVWPNYLPHGFAAPLYEQTHRPLQSENLLVDEPTAAFISGTKTLLQKGDFKPNNYLLALYDLPGLVYLMEGYSPQVTWYFGETTRETLEESVKNACLHISNIDEQDVYIIKPIDIHPEVLECLSNSSLRFPHAYQLEGNVFDPYSKREMQVWSPRR